MCEKGLGEMKLRHNSLSWTRRRHPELNWFPTPTLSENKKFKWGKSNLFKVSVCAFFLKIYSTAQYVDTLSAPTPLLINWDCIAAPSEISQEYLQCKQYISLDLGTFSGPVGEKNRTKQQQTQQNTHTHKTKTNKKQQQKPTTHEGEITEILLLKSSRKHLMYHQLQS